MAPEFNRDRRDFLKKATTGAAVLFGLGLESQAAAIENAARFLFKLREKMPSRLDLSTLPCPELPFARLEKTKKITLAKKLLRTTLAGNNGNVKTFEALKSKIQDDLAELIWGRHEILIRFVRHTLLGRGESALNGAQKRSLEYYHGILGGNNIELGGWGEIRAAIQGKNEQELYRLYKQLAEAYNDDFKTETEPAARTAESTNNRQEDNNTTEQMSPSKTANQPTTDAGTALDSPDAGRRPDASASIEEKKPKEGEEIRPGIFRDTYGWDFGFGIGQQYYCEFGEALHPDLTAFKGRETTGKEADLQLRKGAYEAWTEMTEAAKIDGIQFLATEAYRSVSTQEKLRKKLGILAARVGRSEHHLGTTVDIGDANRKTNYEWLMGLKNGVVKRNLLPNIIKYGFVPTEKKEPWHFRHVGKIAAEAFWKKYGDEIIRSHSKYLRTD